MKVARSTTEVEAKLQPHDDGWVAICPTVGWFRATAATQIQPGDVLGRIEILGVYRDVVLGHPRPGSASPAVFTATAQLGGGERVGVQHGDVLFQLMATNATESDNASATTAQTLDTSLAVRATTSGRFYLRPAPDKPAFVDVGDVVEPGAPLGLLEVMKTFHRLTYGGEGLPGRGRVTRVVIDDGADVEAGEPLFEIEPAR